MLISFLITVAIVLVILLLANLAAKELRKQVEKELDYSKCRFRIVEYPNKTKQGVKLLSPQIQINGAWKYFNAEYEQDKLLWKIKALYEHPYTEFAIYPQCTYTASGKVEVIEKIIYIIKTKGGSVANVISEDPPLSSDEEEYVYEFRKDPDLSLEEKEMFERIELRNKK